MLNPAATGRSSGCGPPPFSTLAFVPGLKNTAHSTLAYRGAFFYPSFALRHFSKPALLNRRAFLESRRAKGRWTAWRHSRGDAFRYDPRGFNGQRLVSATKRSVSGTLVVTCPGYLPAQEQRELASTLTDRERLGQIIVVDYNTFPLDLTCCHTALRKVLRPIALRVPPLHEHGDDIKLLAGQLLKGFDVILEKKSKPKNPKQLSQGAVRLLTAYNWPGNVRQLENIIEMMNLFCPNQIIKASDLQQLGPFYRVP
jgi:hypothetical protein